MEDVPYARILREGWLIILIAAILGGGVAYGVAKLLPETYAATSTLLLQVDSTEASLFERNQFSLARIKSYPALVDSPEVIDGVRSDLGLSEDEYSDRDIRRMLSAENTADTVLLVVRADAPTAELSADMANSAARNLSDLVESTENSGSDDRYQVTMDQVLPAVEPLTPVSPQVLAITGLGLIAGLALGAIVAVYRTTTNRRLSTMADVRRASGLPMVGQIPRRSRLPIPRVQERSDAAAAAAFEDTIGNLAALGGSALSRLALIPVSPDALDDATLAGIREAYLESGRRVTVLDTRAETAVGPGIRPLDSTLVGDDSAHRVKDAHAVAATPSRIPMATLERVIPEIMDRLVAEYEVVIVVCEPGASALVETVEGTGAGILLSVRHNATSATDLVSVTTRLRVMGIRPLGVLMTHAAARSLGVVAESWRESDRQELPPVAVVHHHRPEPVVFEDESAVADDTVAPGGTVDDGLVVTDGPIDSEDAADSEDATDSEDAAEQAASDEPTDQPAATKPRRAPRPRRPRATRPSGRPQGALLIEDPEAATHDAGESGSDDGEPAVDADARQDESPTDGGEGSEHRDD